MTVMRLIFILCIAVAIIDYEANDGRLMASLVDIAIQWGSWVSGQLFRLAKQIVPAR